MLIVSTSPGPERARYLERTLCSLEREPLPEHRVIICDGSLDAIAGLGEGRWTRLALRGVGRRRAGLEALELARAVDEDAIIVEGDVVGCRGAVRAMLEAPVPDGCGLLSFFGAWPPPGFFSGAKGLPRVVHKPARGWKHAQAIKIPRFALDVLARGELLDVAPELLPGGFDVAIAELLHAVGLDVAVAWPSAVQHIGLVSTLAPDLPTPRSPWFPGEEVAYPAAIADMPCVMG